MKLTGRILFGQILQLVKDGVGRRFWQQRRFAFVLTLKIKQIRRRLNNIPLDSKQITTFSTKFQNSIPSASSVLGGNNCAHFTRRLTARVTQLAADRWQVRVAQPSRHPQKYVNNKGNDSSQSFDVKFIKAQRFATRNFMNFNFWQISPLDGSRLHFHFFKNKNDANAKLTSRCKF